MRFTKEFKLECIRKHKKGEHIDDPGGCSHDTFRKHVSNWVRIYDEVGEVGLEHKKPKRSVEDKMAMIKRVMDGESITSVALSNGIQADLLSKWYKIYQKHGIKGLESCKRGRPQKNKMKRKEKAGKPKTREELEKENEYLRAENEYLKN